MGLKECAVVGATHFIWFFLAGYVLVLDQGKPDREGGLDGEIAFSHWGH